MAAFIALYRGINVGGNNPVKMETLRDLHERLGHTSVQSYIQSGNIVFTAKGSPPSIRQKIAAGFEKQFGFGARVLVVDANTWAALVKKNPYQEHADQNPKSVHAALCDGNPSLENLNALLAKTKGTETFAIKHQVVYLHAPDGFGTSKFAAGMEKAAGVPLTARNWPTIEAIDALIRQIV